MPEQLLRFPGSLVYEELRSGAIGWPMAMQKPAVGANPANLWWKSGRNNSERFGFHLESSKQPAIIDLII